MRRVLLFILIGVTALCWTSCNRATKRASFKAQSELDEAFLQMEVRRFDQAFEEAEKAYKRLEELYAAEPDNIDVQLLRIRALLTMFIARNTILIEQAEPRPRSLVRLPRKADYRNYQEFVEPALESLKEMANSGIEYTYEQKATIYGNLGAIFRLDAATSEDAGQAYEKAADAYRHWLFDLKTDDRKVGSNTFAIDRVRHQLRAMAMNQAEAYLLAENWEESLKTLKLAMAGDDLKFFTVQFDMLEQQIAAVENRMREEEEATPHSREVRLQQLVRDRKRRNLSKREELGGYSPQQAELLFAQSELADLKNNLMYRIIALYNMNQEEDLDQARQILRVHYPELDADLWSQLQSTK